MQLCRNLRANMDGGSLGFPGGVQPKQLPHSASKGSSG